MLRIKRAALDQRFDRGTIERTLINALAEVVEALERPFFFASFDDLQNRLFAVRSMPTRLFRRKRKT